MFSSSGDSTAAAAAGTTNPLPDLPLPPTTFHGGDNHHILLPHIQDHHHHHHHHLFPNNIHHILLSPNNNNNVVINSKPQSSKYVFPRANSSKTIGIKKDRHTKILTAQGPRDRRVRLSICIARKFFDLQDTLGFDKPSKTLNWLFSKSKLAIDELIHTTTGDDSDNNSQEMGPKRAQIISPNNKVDSRAKARARARARTIKKMCIKELSEAKMLLPSSESNNYCPVTVKQAPLKESFFAPTNSPNKAAGSVWDVPQHLMMPKDLGFFGDNTNNNNSNGYSRNNATTTWNINASTIMCGVSSSQVLQICRKSWDFTDHNNPN